MVTFEIRLLTFELRHAQFCRNKRFLVAQRSPPSMAGGDL